MSKVVNGFTLNENGDPAPWGTVEEDYLTAVANVIPASGSTMVASQHLHSELWADESNIAWDVDTSGNISGVGNISGGLLYTTGTITGTSIDTGNGQVECFAMNQAVQTTDNVTFNDISGTGNISGQKGYFTENVSCPTINTGNGNVECYAMDQAVRTTDNVTFGTVDTGQGANELYAMNQDVQTTDNVVFNNISGTGAISGANGKLTAYEPKFVLQGNRDDAGCDSSLWQIQTASLTLGNGQAMPLIFQEQGTGKSLVVTANGDISGTGSISGTNAYINGKLGVGTNSPATQVNLNKTTGNAQIGFSNDGTQKAGIGLEITGGEIVGGSSENDLSLRTVGGNILFSAAAGGGEHMRISGNGNIGMGTNTPGNALDVVTGSTTNSAVHIGEADNEGMYLTSALPSQGLFGAGCEYVDGSWIARGTEAGLIELREGYMAVTLNTGLTDGNSFNPTPRLRLNEAGLGLGTTIPGNVLDIAVGATDNSAVHIGKAVDEGCYITSVNDNHASIGAGVEIVSGSWTARSTEAASFVMDNGIFAFYGDTSLTDGNTYTPTERMRLTADGNFGIGTTPGNTLDIVSSDAANNSIVHIGGAIDEGMYLTSINDNYAVIGGGIEFVAGNWTARSTKASMLVLDEGEAIVYGDTGLTDGNAYTPTILMRVDSTGLGAGTAFSLVSPSTTLHAIGSSGILGDYTGVTAIEDSNNAGISIGYNATLEETWIYSRDVGVEVKGFSVNGQAFRLTKAGNVGINVVTPRDKFHVVDSKAMADSNDANAVIENNGGPSVLALDGNTGSNAAIRFQTSGTSHAEVGYDQNNDHIYIGPEGTVSGAINVWLFDGDNNVGIKKTDPASALDVNGTITASNITCTGTIGSVDVNASDELRCTKAAGNGFYITNSHTPASAGAAGTQGTIAWDASYIYVCTSTNTWKRAALSTW